MKIMWFIEILDIFINALKVYVSYLHPSSNSPVFVGSTIIS